MDGLGIMSSGHRDKSWVRNTEVSTQLRQGLGQEY